MQEPSVVDTEMKKAVLTAFNALLQSKDSYTEQLVRNMEKVVSETTPEHMKAMENDLLTLQEELIRQTAENEDLEDVTEKIILLRRQKQETDLFGANRAEILNRIRDLKDFIETAPAKLTAVEDTLVNKWIEEITIYKDKMTIRFKSGLEMEVEE